MENHEHDYHFKCKTKDGYVYECKCGELYLSETYPMTITKQIGTEIIY